MLVVEILIAAYIIYISIRAKRYLPVLLVFLQSVIMLSFEFTSGRGMQIEHSLFVDKFSIIMALIVVVSEAPSVFTRSDISRNITSTTRR